MIRKIKQKNISVGADIESISRFKNLNKERFNIFLKRIFTEKEIKYCYSKKEPAQHLAVRFAGKEAVIKAVSGMDGSELTRDNIEILRDKGGAPRVRVLGGGTKCSFRISLSHSRNKAIAFVVAFKN